MLVVFVVLVVWGSVGSGVRMIGSGGEGGEGEGEEEGEVWQWQWRCDVM